MSEYGYTVEVPEGYDEAILRTRIALRVEGFSILTEMHVGGVLGPQAGDARQYLFMGVWTPELGHDRLDETLQVSAHLPCNFVVQELEGTTLAVVVTNDPRDLVDGSDPVAAGAARDAFAALERAFKRIAERLEV